MDSKSISEDPGVDAQEGSMYQKKQHAGFVSPWLQTRELILMVISGKAEKVSLQLLSITQRDLGMNMPLPIRTSRDPALPPVPPVGQLIDSG